jgi:hypothetical protein
MIIVCGILIYGGERVKKPSILADIVVYISAFGLLDVYVYLKNAGM